MYFAPNIGHKNNMGLEMAILSHPDSCFPLLQMFWLGQYNGDNDSVDSL